jgi:hypothetical protein
MGSRRAARISGGGRRLTAWGAVAPFVLFAVMAATSPGLASAETGGASPSAGLPIQAPVAAPAFRALCPPTAAPGSVTCFALVRTDVAPMARAAVGPGSAPGGYSPTDLRSAYALTAAAASNGGGITVGVIDFSDLPTAESDLAAYRSQFGLGACTTANGCFKKIDEHGGTNYPAANAGWGGEIALDIEMVSAICPKCHILLVEASNTFVSDLGTAVNTAVSKGAAVISNSYGGPDYSSEASDDSAYYNHPGIAITASTGDLGFGVQFPAASPHVTSVGGTSLVPAGNARGWSETAWDGAGSGCSSYEGKPSFQHDVGCSNRAVADVSAVADTDTPVAFYINGSWMEAGGTSVAAPIIAGVYALAGKPTTGTYSVSYPYAQAAQLNDVTSGSNGSCSPAYLCTAGTGYDGPTGLGTPNGIGAFTSPLLPAAPTAVTGVAGDTTVAVSWHAASGNGHPITGYTATATPGGASCTTTGTLTCSVGGLTNGSSYTFRVTATNSVGSGPASTASASIVPATVPDAPAGVAATAGDSSALVSWTGPGSNGGAPVNGYTVTSSPAAGTCTTTGALSCTVLGLTDGTAYTFTVTAQNVMGSSAPSAASSSVTPETVPGATYVTVTPNRLVDSRIGVGLSSGLSANVAKTFTVINRSLGDSTRNIPSDAVAITGNVTVTGQTAAGYLAVTPVATNTPTTATLNFPLADNRGNGLTVALGAGGTLSVTYVAHAGATTDVVFDVTGYFVPPPG